MLAFKDFDAWADAVSGASLSLVCDAVETRRWTLGLVPLGDVVLQVAAEGGGNLCYGVNTHPGPIVFVPLTLAAEHVVNAEQLDDDAFFVIPRGTDFRIRVRRRAHSWCSIALPSNSLVATTPASTSGRIACRPGSVSRLRRLVQGIAASLLERQPGSNAHQAAGLDLVDVLSDCLPGMSPTRSPMGRPRLDRSDILRRAMETIETATTMPTARNLAREIGVTDRTLLRAFQETYGVPPKKYLIIRELHVIRRILRDETSFDGTVADVLTRHGIWEFGRFAGRYRAHFGELPSETLHRARE